MKRIVLLLLLPLMTLGIGAAHADDSAKPKLLMFDFALQDDMKPDLSSADDPVMLQRTLTLSDDVRTYLANEGQFDLIDNSKHREAIARVIGARNFYGCRACYMDAAKKVGAEYVAVGWVERISNLIIEFNMRIESVATGKVVDKAYVSIRGNTDKSWHDGFTFLIKDYRNRWTKG